VFGNLCVVPMKSGFSGYDADNVRYVLHVENGPDKGQKFTLRAGDSTLGSGAKANVRLTDKSVAAAALNLNLSGEILTVSVLGGGGEEGDEEAGDDEGGEGGAGVWLDGAVLPRGTAFNNSQIKIGKTTLRVEDRGAAALWHDLAVDGILVRVGNKLIVRKGNKVGLVSVASGEPAGEMTNLPGVRLFPTATDGSSLFVVGGDAVLYAHFAR
jgi:hypothetical protein